MVLSPSDHLGACIIPRPHLPNWDWVWMSDFLFGTYVPTSFSLSLTERRVGFVARCILNTPDDGSTALISIVISASSWLSTGSNCLRWYGRFSPQAHLHQTDGTLAIASLTSHS